MSQSVFISYRHTNFHTALAVYQGLAQRGFDVFMRTKGDEDEKLTQVRTQAHFLVIISPSTTEAWMELKHPFRKELETALESQRNIIPLVMEGFDSNSPSVQKAISGKLTQLKNFSGLRLYSEYFYAGMEKLCARCQNPVIEEKPSTSQGVADEIKNAPPVQMKELVTEEWFERGVAFAQHQVWEDAIHAFSEALRARPEFGEAYYRRGCARQQQGDYEGALADFDQTLRFRSDFPKAYLGRGIVHQSEHRFKRALADFNKALELNPKNAQAYYQRGKAYAEKGQLKKAISDYDAAIRLDPEIAAAYNERGIERYNQNNFKGALSDYNAALRIDPQFADAYNSRGLVRGIQNDLEGAIADFSQALFIEPDYAAAYYNRAAIWQRKKAYAAALTDYQKYLNLSKGMLYGNQEKVQEIIRELKRKI